MKILVTGAAGFIGFHTASALLARGDEVVGVDNLSDYYDVALKEARLAQLRRHAGFRFLRLDLAEREATARAFAAERPARVVHLAAQPGVRHGITHPHDYADANLVAFLNVLEGCRRNAAEHLVFASTSSVYGANLKMPYSVHDNVDHPFSLYAATKKANELMAHSYAHLYGLPVTGLRFFTVYGPWGRPDMSPFIFTRKILAGEPIQIFNNGNHARDFTYVDDIVEGVVRVTDRPATASASWRGDDPDPATSAAPYRIHNIGSSNPVELMDFIAAIEEALGRTAEKIFLPMQPGDVPATYADVEALAEEHGYRPQTPVRVGIQRFVDWYRGFYSAGRAEAFP